MAPHRIWLVSMPARNQLAVRLFGHAAVSRDGTPIKFAKRSTTLAMLAFIVLKAGLPISREALAYAIFPEEDEDSALAELRRYLYLANKALSSNDAPFLIADAETVRWNVESGAFVDVLEFERLASDPQTQARAIEFYAGDLLEDVYEDWVVAERERLRMRYLNVLQDLVERHRANRDFQAAISYAKRILAADSWREDTLRTLVALRYESGDTAGALAEYEQFAKRLRDDLAIAPMPETVALRQSILRNEAVPGSLEPPPAYGESKVQTSRVLPFVGRERELTKLHAAWTRAARGTGSFLLVDGEAGVGKTRLIAELLRRVQSEGGRAFVGTTSSPESMPYQAVAEALRSAMPLLLARPGAAARLSALSRLMPELHDAGAVIHDEEPDARPERQAARIHEALVAALKSIASPRPLVVVLEDLHWAGAATADALGAIAREIGRSRILIIGSCRDEETPPNHAIRLMQRQLAVSNTSDDVPIDRLAEEDVASLVGRVDGLRARGADLARRLYAQSEGNALFLNEAISVALEGAATGVRVPASVAELIAARVGALGAEARGVAEIAAVAGVGFTVALIREVSNAQAAAIARGIDELLDRRILREAGARTTHDYVFSHHLIVESIYGGIDPAFRSQRHLRIARYLESVHPDDLRLPRAIADHYERAGDSEGAATWYVNAARSAATLYAYADAIELSTRAVALSSSKEVQAAALDIRERSRSRRGDRDGQREDIEALERLAAGDPAAQFDVSVRRVLLARSVGDSAEEARCIDVMRRAAEMLDSDDARAQTLLQAATHAQVSGRAAESLELARSALTLYETLRNVRGQFECLFLLVDITSNVGDMESSRAYLEAMRQRAVSLADRSTEARALSIAATAELLRQQYRACFEFSQRGLAVYSAIGDREGEAFSHGRLAVSAAWLGDYSTALSEFDYALRGYESIANKRGLALAHTNRAVLLMRLGLLDDALASIGSANALFEVVREKRTMVTNQVNESFINLQLGNADVAKSLAAKAVEAAREIGYPLFEAAALANLGNAERVLGNTAAAMEHLERALTIRRPIQEARDFADDLADLTLTYVEAGRRAEALARARELSGLKDSGFSGALWPQYVWWAMATGLAAGNASSDAHDAASRAREELARFAERIEDAAMRDAFLALPINQRIAAGLEKVPSPSRGGRRVVRQ